VLGWTWQVLGPLDEKNIKWTGAQLEKYDRRRGDAPG